MVSGQRRGAKATELCQLLGRKTSVEGRVSQPAKMVPGEIVVRADADVLGTPIVRPGQCLMECTETPGAGRTGGKAADELDSPYR